MASSPESALSSSKLLQDILTSHGPPNILPSEQAIQTATKTILKALPATGLGLETTATHLLHDITPGLNGTSLSPNYYGFVTGGHTPISLLADYIVSTWDQNVAVHLPSESLATVVEDRALDMLCQLFDLPAESFLARTLTTGATASNILGLAAAREYLLRSFSQKVGIKYDPGQGLFASCFRAGLRKIQILTTMPHSSLRKAASIVGLGSGSLVDVSVRSSDGGPGIRFDLHKLEGLLSEVHTASIVAISCSEVNLGGYAVTSRAEMQQLRDLCDKYGAWIHVDAAFGIYASLLPDLPQYQTLRSSTAGLDLADSITSDAHKLLNVPYDTGIFFSRHPDIMTTTFSNSNAPYLRSSASDNIISPMNLGLENSRRWRALPVYATLLAYGRSGYSEMITRMVQLARAIAEFILAECPWLELLLPQGNVQGESSTASVDGVLDSPMLESVFMVVAFRDRDALRNETFVQRINQDARIYVSGTVLQGQPAVRIAVAKWDVNVQRDLALVKEVLLATR